MAILGYEGVFNGVRVVELALGSETMGIFVAFFWLPWFWVFVEIGYFIAVVGAIFSYACWGCGEVVTGGVDSEPRISYIFTIGAILKWCFIVISIPQRISPQQIDQWCWHTYQLFLGNLFIDFFCSITWVITRLLS